jgi:hypothetical protein
MNIKSNFTLLLCVALLSLTGLTASAQSLKNVPTGVAWFYLGVEQNMYIPMDISSKTMMAINFQKPEPDADALMSNTYELIKKLVAESGKLELLPPDALKGAVTLSRMGYPIGNLKKAAKGGKLEQYATLDVVVGQQKTTTTTRTYANNQNTGVVDAATDQTLKLYPEVTVTLKVSDASGKVIDKYVGNYRHDEKIEITKQSLQSNGWSMVIDQKGDVIPYYYYLELATKNLISKL